MSSDNAQCRRSGLLCGQRAGTPDALPLEDVFDNLMLRLVWLEQKRWAHILAGHGLTVSQFLALAAIWERQHGCHMGQLAAEMLQSSATMTGIVDRLVRMELVHRQEVATDRRLVLIDLTARGRGLLALVHGERIAYLQRILDRLPAADRGELIRLLSAYLELSDE